jgi:hypothetical protein
VIGDEAVVSLDAMRWREPGTGARGPGD